MPLKKIPREILVPLVGDGGIQSAYLGEGRMIPVLILDCSKHLELRELIVQHRNYVAGDVLSNWGKKLFQNKTIFLHLKFVRPIKLQILVEFDLEKYANLVDMIVHAHGAYLQPQEFGESVSAGFGNPKIIIEIPSDGYFKSWDKIYHKYAERKARLSGMDRKDAKEAGEMYVREFRKIFKSRIPERNSPED